MACVIEPKVGPDSENLKWDPMQIPSTKPFLNISTSADEPLSSCEDMNFIKTKSLIYSPFHSTAQYVNFDIGYAKDAKWLDSINDKWSDYANFFIGGFFEATYTANEKTYMQVNAKLIDYDVRFRNQNFSNQPRSPVKAQVNNAFMLRRSKSSASLASLPSSPKSTKQKSNFDEDETISLKSTTRKQKPNSESEDEQNNDSESEYLVNDRKSNKKLNQYETSTSSRQREEESDINPKQSRRRKLSNLCLSEDESTNDPINNELVNELVDDKEEKSGRGEKSERGEKSKRGGRGGGRGKRGAKGRK